MEQNKFLAAIGVLVTCLVLGSLALYWFVFRVKPAPPAGFSEEIRLNQIGDLESLRGDIGSTTPADLKTQQKELNKLKQNITPETSASQLDELNKSRL